MKRKTATITFHAAHNYGSMLQAYALQQTLLSMGVDNEIINFRTERQKNFYPNPLELQNVGWFKKFKFFAFNLLIRGYKDSLFKKYKLFEDFLCHNLILTKEYATSDEIKTALPNYDYYITGSDQCWNTYCGDFDWAYYLDFTDSENKISYASSFGSTAPNEEIQRIKEEVSKFKVISVRESGSADYIKKTSGISVEIMPDPTFLIPNFRWVELAGDSPIIKVPYIFVYTPFARHGTIEIAKRLSRKTGFSIVISNEPTSKDLIKLLLKKNIIFKMGVGPIEFLNLIKNARYVVTGSFHAVVFSLIFRTPFLAVDGLKDNRMSELLSRFGCKDMAIEFRGNDKSFINKYLINVPEKVTDIINTERNKAMYFLRHALGINI